MHPVPPVSGNSVPATERLLCGERPGEAPASWDQALGLTQVPAGAHALEAGKREELSSGGQTEPSPTPLQSGGWHLPVTPFHLPAFVTVQNFKVAYKEFELLEVGRQELKASPTLAAIVTTSASCLALPTAITGSLWPAPLPSPSTDLGMASSWALLSALPPLPGLLWGTSGTLGGVSAPLG